jgi:hypothetical protein
VAIPGWVEPTVQQVLDAHRLAYSRAASTGHWRDKGRAEGLQWGLTGGQAPIGSEVLPRPPELLEALEALRVSAQATRTSSTEVSREWAVGVEQALAWLLAGDGDPGIPLPRRHPDGRVLTEDELYAELNPQPGWAPEQRLQARDTARRRARLYRELAELVDTA